MSEKLTAREEEVCNLVTRGFSGKAIAAKLNISHRTVEVHRQVIFTKYGVRNAAALTRIVVTDELTAGGTE